MNPVCNPPTHYHYGPVVPPDLIDDEYSRPVEIEDVNRLRLGIEPTTYPVKKFVLQQGSMDKVRLDKLKALLLENPYDGPHSSSSGKGLYTWDYLQTTLPATDEELEDALSLLSAVEIDGHWRLLDCGYLDEVLESLLSLASQSESTLIDGVKAVNTLADLGFGISKEAVSFCLARFATSIDSRVWDLDTQRISVQFALNSLYAYTNMTVEAFLRNWANGGLPVGLDMVAGEIVLEKIGNEYWVSLPSDRYGPNLTPVFHEMD